MKLAKKINTYFFLFKKFLTFNYLEKPRVFLCNKYRDFSKTQMQPEWLQIAKEY